MFSQEFDKQQARVDKLGKKTAQSQPGTHAKQDLVNITMSLKGSVTQFFLFSCNGHLPQQRQTMKEYMDG